ncbi:MAG: hypothetical protein O7G30_18375 [Proteobacteria bacterium]|nr:hypothetical protein [Pseudomonadota bacterium]
MSLADALERAASELAGDADAIRPANGDPIQLLGSLDHGAAVRVLTWLLANEPEAGDELAVRWAEQEDGAAPLAAVDESALPKAGRKALRRARHRLRSRGVAVDEAPAEPVVARLPDVGDALELGFVSLLDSRGGQLVYLVESKAGGGARLFEVVLDEVRGVVDLEIYSAGRSVIRRFLRDVTSRARFPAQEADPSSVRALIARVDAAMPADCARPRAFGEWRSRLLAGVKEASVLTPGEQARDALGDETNPPALKRAAELVEQGEFGPWPPDRGRLETLAEKLREQAESRLIVSGARRTEQLNSLVQDAAVELFSGDFAGQTARRFLESAYGLWKSGREDDARACLAASSAFSGDAPADQPAARALIESALGPLLATLRATSGDQQSGKQDGESSLLVEP